MIHTANTDSFAASYYSTTANSMAVVGGVLVGLDVEGAFALDGADDGGVDFDAWIETDWSAFAEELADALVQTDTLKRIRAGYVYGSLPADGLWLEVKNGSGIVASVPLDTLDAGASGRPTQGRFVPPQGMTAVAWKFRLGSSGPGSWRVVSARLSIEILSRRI